MNRKVIILVISIIVVLIILSTTTYALFFRKDKLDSTESYTAGILDIVIENNEEGLGETLNLANSLPITDSEGKKSTPYKFKITNKGNLSYTFDLLLNNTTTSNQINADYIKIMIDNNEPVTLSNLENNIIASDLTLNPGESKIISIRIWLDINTPNTEIGKVFSAKITSEGIGSEYVESSTAVDVITSLLSSNPTTMNNDDPDGNIRYMGADPNNYVSFNNELWRIIGVFDVKSSENGQSEKRLKIIRDDPIGNYSWDSGVVSVTLFVPYSVPDVGNGENDWSQASLEKYLNGEYLNSIDSVSQELIGDTLWNIGGSSSGIMVNDFYNSERGTEVYNGRPTTWVGKIGLMYLSDYGYATSGGTTTNRSSCLAQFNWYDSGYSDCKNNDYLYDSSSDQWTLNPASGYHQHVFSLGSTGLTYIQLVDKVYFIRPTFYLNSNVQITSGDGSSTNPYILS